MRLATAFNLKQRWVRIKADFRAPAFLLQVLTPTPASQPSICISAVTQDKKQLLLTPAHCSSFFPAFRSFLEPGKGEEITWRLRLGVLEAKPGPISRPWAMGLGALEPEGQ